MKTSRSLALIALVLVAVARAQTPAAPPPDDPAWAVVQESFAGAKANAGAPRPPPDNPPAVLQWGLRYVKGLLVAAGDYYEKHPADPRRWTGVLQMVDKFESWAGREQSWSDAERQAADAILTAAERNEWRKKLEELRTAAIAASDIAPSERIYFDSRKYFFMCKAADAALRAKQPADLAMIKAEFDRLVKTYPDQPGMAGRANGYVALKQLAGATPDEIKQEWQMLATSPSEIIRQAAVERLRNLDFAGRPLDLAFTAADGRAVDLKNLRGKVVLVDFWATWCGPCIAELPNVKKVYAEYHAKGFEVIGIALEDGKLLPNDTPEQTAEKLAKAKKVLTDFTAKNDLPWPQHFDGKYWKNEISTRFDIKAVPAMFLLDQDGKVVSKNARGPKLEEEVKRLLKL